MFYLVVPVGHEAPIRRIPVVSIAIVVLNVAIFLATRSDVDWWERERQLVAEELEQLRRIAYSRHVEDLRHAAGGAGAEAVEPLDPTTMWQRWAAGDHEVVPEALRDDLVALDERARAVEQHHPFERYGFEPRHPTLRAFFGHLFLHAGWAHLIGNMFFFVVTAAHLEYAWGAIAFTLFYLLGGAAGDFAMLGYDVDGLIGSSGAVFACMGGFIARYGRSRLTFFGFVWAGLTYVNWGLFRLPAWVFLGYFALWEILYTTLGSPSGELIAHAAHVGGFAFGLGVGLFLGWAGLDRWVLGRRLEHAGVVPAGEAPLEQAIELAAKGSYHAVPAALKAARSRWGDHPTFVGVEARTLARTAEPAEAAASLRRLVALLEAGRGRPEDAADAWGALRVRSGGEALDPADLMRLARVLDTAGETDEAVAALGALSRWHPDHVLAPKALLRAGQLLGDVAGDVDGARARYEAVLERYPTSPLASHARAALDRLPAGGAPSPAASG